MTIWLTGLPGAGKTTNAKGLAARLVASGRSVVVIDGDELRAGVSSDLGFSAEDRDENVRRAGELALLVASQGVLSVVSLVSPRRAAREAVRRRHEALGVPFVEVHVAAPLEVCEARDPKSLYRRARAGDVAQMTGVSDPYEPPLEPEIVLATHELSENEALDLLERRILGG